MTTYISESDETSKFLLQSNLVGLSKQEASFSNLEDEIISLGFNGGLKTIANENKGCQKSAVTSSVFCHFLYGDSQWASDRADLGGAGNLIECKENV